MARTQCPICHGSSVRAEDDPLGGPREWQVRCLVCGYAGPWGLDEESATVNFLEQRVSQKEVKHDG